MSDIYRPLFVLVEAVEAECRRLLATQPEPPLRASTADFEAAIRTVFGDKSIRLERSPLDRVIEVSHRCRLCGRRHCAAISENALEAAYIPAHLLADTVNRLLERPCDIELAGTDEP